MQTFIIKTINVYAQLFHVDFKVYDVMSTPVFIARENATHLQIKKKHSYTLKICVSCQLTAGTSSLSDGRSITCELCRLSNSKLAARIIMTRFIAICGVL